VKRAGKNGKKQTNPKPKARRQIIEVILKRQPLPYLPFQLNTSKIPFTATQASKE